MASHTRTASKPESTLSTPPPEPTSSDSDFDIHETYKDLLTSQPALTKPLAAISALIALLPHPKYIPSTISETLSLLSHHSEILKNSVKNPIAVKAGTDLWGRYVVGVLQSPTSGGNPNNEGEEEFSAVLRRVIENGEIFVERAKEARNVIAKTAKGFVQDGMTVLTVGRSRCVSATLHAAADEGVQFRVIYVEELSSGSSKKSSNRLVGDLRQKGIPVATIPQSAVAYSLSKIDIVMVGAESVLENGGIVSGLGTYQLAMLAKSTGKPMYAVAESHKFVRVFPLGQEDLGVRQKILDFTGQNDWDIDTDDRDEGKAAKEKDGEEFVDYTPPELITSLVTEIGVLTPSAVSEELIKIWY
ncbi:MAG: hypothetical protein Q9218_002803 [Villophora microphyllina]